MLSQAFQKVGVAVSYLLKSVTRSQPFLTTCSYMGVTGYGVAT
jgi:hypothetical protein